MTKKRILVADVPAGLYRAQRSLSGSYDLYFAATVREAKQLLDESATGKRFDLVIAGLQFDDSRIFELLQYIRNVDLFDHTPFLPTQELESKMPIDQSSKETLEILGACPLVILTGLEEDQANKRLQEATEEAFSRPVSYKRVDKKNNPRIPPGKAS